MKRYLLLVAIIASPLAHAGDTCDDPLTAGDVNQCGKSDLLAANTRLDAAYQSALKQIELRRLGSESSNAARQQLVDSQELWINFREKYCDAIYSLWRDESTPAGVRTSMQLSCILDQTRQRAKELEWSYSDK